MADLIGQRFGNYRLTTLLGSGGFAEVYLGEHVRLGMQAAIKILHAHLGKEDAEAFQAEARTIAELIHPHIIRVLDFDVENSMPFLVLDYAPEGSLRRRHKRGEQVPLERVVAYASQVADALQYAHDRKHVHRDVKPENMLIGRQGEILLSDFGIASIAHSTSSMNTEAPLGTLAYMAPEQIQGHARPASDQYALGVTVYQWLTGVMPFRGSSAEVIGQQLAGTPAPLRSIVPTLSPALEKVVMVALDKDPRARFNDIRAFARELTQASQQQRSHTISYTATTVPGPDRGAPPVITPPFAPQPALHTPKQVAPLPSSTPAGSAQNYANATPEMRPASYLQPATPYTPPAEPSRIGWSVFWRGSIMAACFLAVAVLANILLPSNALMIELSIFAALSLGGGLGASRKTGLVRAGIFSNLWYVFWIGCVVAIATFGQAARSGGTSSSGWGTSLLIMLLLASACTVLGFLGGLAGRSIYRARQPIHPPAGGSGWSIN